jgi:hypothetical protein
MNEAGTFLRRSGKTLAEVCLACLLGLIIGGACGAVILSLGDLVGQSGDTGKEYLGYWNIATAELGLLYGGFFGAFVAPLAYILRVRTIGFQRAFAPALLGTLLGGCTGAFVSPPIAAISGISGFFLAVYWAKPKPSTPISAENH